MYAGRIVERARASALFRAPRHPYTLGLLNSFPPLHGAHRQMTGIPGSPPDLRALPQGCVFHPRCGYAMDRCRTQAPPLVPLAGQGGRLAACWLQDAGAAAPPELSQDEQAAAARASALLPAATPAAATTAPAAASAAADTRGGLDD
jgi:peptide/nickel transport system ATP-binding protein